MPIPAGDCADVCIYNGAEGDEPDFITTANVKARKPYRCCECRETIPAKTIYQRTAGKWDGHMDTYRTCLACAEVRGAMCCEGWTYGSLWEDAEESLFQTLTTGCLGALTTAAAKAKVIERWRWWKGLDDAPGVA